MSRLDKIPESDWKRFRKLKDDLLNRLCSRINSRVEGILNGSSLSDYERYLKVFDEIRRSDKIIGRCFDDLKRSELTRIVLNCYRENLFTDEEFSGFSQQMKDLVEDLKNL